MAKQTFTAGQVLTAAEMNSLQENDYNWTVTTKTASYTLAAGDEGTRIVMNNAGATTITVDDSVFAAGDVVWLHNIGAGTCTVTAGTATVNTTGELALEQYAGGQLYFTSASSAIFFPSVGAQAGGKILQVVNATHSTQVVVSSTSYAATGVAATITPTAATSKVLVIITNPMAVTSEGNSKTSSGSAFSKLYRGGSEIHDFSQFTYTDGASTSRSMLWNGTLTFIDSPATTSATTYEQYIASTNTDYSTYSCYTNNTASITLMEVAA